jgi:hypothetical protein
MCHGFSAKKIYGRQKEERLLPLEDGLLPLEDGVLPSEDGLLPPEARVLLPEDAGLPVEARGLPGEDRRLPREEGRLRAEDTRLPSEDRVLPSEDVLSTDGALDFVMPARRLASVAFVLVAAAGCTRASDNAAPCNPDPVPSPMPIAPGTVGEPCATSAPRCASDLACAETDVMPRLDLFSCTSDCADASCPTGFACAPRAGGSFCVRACGADSDCVGASVSRAGSCAHTSLDAGLCAPLTCAPPGYAGGPSCPSGYLCVGFQPCGCDPRYPCDETPGWCQRLPDGG